MIALVSPHCLNIKGNAETQEFRTPLAFSKSGFCRAFTDDRELHGLGIPMFDLWSCRPVLHFATFYGKA